MARFDEKNFTNPQAAEYEPEKQLSDGETILWRGKPDRKAHIWAQIFGMLPVAIIWLLFDAAFIYLIACFGVFRQLPWFAAVGICIFFVLHLAPVWIWIYKIVTASRRQKNTEYVFTDKRIIIKSGVIGIDVSNIYYTEINGVNLKVGLSDRIFKVGDIYISGAFRAQVLWDIDSPYEVTAKLQKIVNDIRTDVYYPNNLRPEENGGKKD